MKNNIKQNLSKKMNKPLSKKWFVDPTIMIVGCAITTAIMVSGTLLSWSEDVIDYDVIGKAYLQTSSTSNANAGFDVIDDYLQHITKTYTSVSDDALMKGAKALEWDFEEIAVKDDNIMIKHDDEWRVLDQEHQEKLQKEFQKKYEYFLNENFSELVKARDDFENMDPNKLLDDIPELDWGLSSFQDYVKKDGDDVYLRDNAGEWKPANEEDLQNVQEKAKSHIDTILERTDMEELKNQQISVEQMKNLLK